MNNRNYLTILLFGFILVGILVLRPDLFLESPTKADMDLLRKEFRTSKASSIDTMELQETLVQTKKDSVATNSPVQVVSAKVEATETPDYEQIIRGFLKAEDSQDFKRILPFFASKVHRYYEQKFPTKEALRKSYAFVQKRTLDPSNEVIDIAKRENHTYDLQTNFTFIDRRKSTRKSAKSTIRFVFDEKGKILETFQLK